MPQNCQTNLSSKIQCFIKQTIRKLRSFHVACINNFTKPLFFSVGRSVHNYLYRLIDLLCHIATLVGSSQSQKKISIISPKLLLEACKRSTYTALWHRRSISRYIYFCRNDFRGEITDNILYINYIIVNFLPNNNSMIDFRAFKNSRKS